MEQLQLCTFTYIDFGITISEIFQTENDPYGTNTTNDLALKISMQVISTNGEAVLPDRSSTSPVWVYYRAPFPSMRVRVTSPCIANIL